MLDLTGGKSVKLPDSIVDTDSWISDEDIKKYIIPALYDQSSHEVKYYKNITDEEE